MAVNYAERASQRKRARNNSRPRSDRSREQRLEQQVKILADRFALAVTVLRDGHTIHQMACFDQLEYLQGWATTLLEVELGSHVSKLTDKHDELRSTDLYKRVMNMTRGMLRRQVLEGNPAA